MIIVPHQIGVEYSSSLFDKKRSLFPIDELSDIFFCLCSGDKREPYRFWLAISVGDDLYTLSIVELIIKRDDMTIYLGYCDSISEVRVDRICKIYRRRSLGKCDNIATRGEYEYLVFEYIHLHLMHELTSSLLGINDSFDRLHPVAVFGLLTLATLTILKMSSDTDLSLEMHLSSSYLYLSRLGAEVWK